jgi:hypothetical protein
MADRRSNIAEKGVQVVERRELERVLGVQLPEDFELKMELATAPDKATRTKGATATLVIRSENGVLVKDLKAIRDLKLKEIDPLCW